MDDKGLLNGILCIIISLIVIVTVAIPVISSVTTPESDVEATEDNQTYTYRMAVAGASETHTLNVISVSDGQYTFDGRALNPTSENWNNSNIIVCDTLILYMRTVANRGFFDGMPYNTALGDGDSVVWSNGTWTFTDASGTAGSNTYTGTYSTLIYPSSSGSYALFNSGTLWADTDATIYTVLIQGNMGDAFNSLAGLRSGTVTGELTGTLYQYNTNNQAPIVAEGTAITTISTNETGVYANRISSQASTSYTPSGGGETTSGTTPIIAPLSYHVVPPEEEGDAVLSIAGMIPVLLVVGLIIAAAGVIITRRIN